MSVTRRDFARLFALGGSAALFADPEFAAALKSNPRAMQVLEGFPPSAQREYLDWVAEAKQDKTRAKRIADAVQWLSEGKRRMWKYEKC